MRLVNLSLSTANEIYAETFWGLVDQAAYRNVILVSALNNERKRSIPSEFAGSSRWHARRATTASSCGSTGEVRRSGVPLASRWRWRGRGAGRSQASGNSFAAPVVTGHLARILGAHPDITPWQARTILAAIAHNAARAR